MKFRTLAIATAALMTVAGQASAKNLICVWDVAGKSGDVYNAAIDYGLAMQKAAGVEIDLKSYVDERVAVEDFRTGQCDAVMATAKHFAGYGAAIGGRDYNATDMSERHLREVILPPFKAAADAGVATFMNSFNDLNGTPATGSFEFRPGGIFANVVLADEINRATPKTQSALLEAMQEHRVSVGKRTYVLDEPFVVLATQNPLEMEGTYPLPEAQLDRFFFKLVVGYSGRQELMTVIDRTTRGEVIVAATGGFTGAAEAG